MIKQSKKYCKLSELKVNVGEAKLLLNQKKPNFWTLKHIIYSIIKTEISSKVCCREMVYSNWKKEEKKEDTVVFL